MATYLCDMTAFNFWFGTRATALRVGSFASVEDLADADAAARRLPERELERFGLASYPVHVLVPSHRTCRTSARVVSHLWSGAIPEHSFVCLAPGLYILAPVPTLIGRATVEPPGRLLALCNELCARYRLDGGTIRNCAPLATPEELRTYARAAVGMRGVKRLRPLLPLVEEGAASPREAQLAALLRMRVQRGGCGLPPFEMNAPLEVLPGEARRFGDDVWEEERLVLEYESNEFHTGAERIGRDSARRAQLEERGYRVVTLTNMQLMDEREFLRVAGLLRALLGRGQLPVGDAGYLQRHRELRRAVLGR